MKIAIIASYFGSEEGGAEISTKLLVDELLAKKIDVSVITTEKAIQTNKQTNCEIKQIKFLGFLPLPFKAILFNTNLFDSYIKRSLVNVLKEIKPDIIHLQDMHLLPATILAAKELNIKTVMTVRDYRFVCNLPTCLKHGNLIFFCSKKQYLKCLLQTAKKQLGFSFLGFLLYPFIVNRPKTYRKSLANIDNIVANSKFTQNILTKAGFNSRSIPVIYNLAPKWSFNMPTNKETVTLLALGRLEEYKGFPILVNAMKLIKNNLHLFIAGKGPQGKYLKRLVIKNNLKNKVTFKGAVNYKKVYDLYLSSDIVILPSIWPEPLSRVILEAFTIGRPLIATNSGGTSEYVINNKTGSLLPINNAEAMAKSISKLASNYKLRKKLAIKARKLMKGHNKKQVNLYIQLYKNLAVQ